MKQVALRRVSAIAVTAVLLFTTVFSLSIFANAATFSPRLSAPAKSNKYYYSNLNVYYRSGWGMPNCTAYAFGRAYEITGKEPKLSWYNAETWYDYNRNGGYYKYGKTPKVGAIACWSYGSGGHVAIVEKINSDGSMVLSNSGYNYLEFYLTYANKNDSNPGGNSWWTFQGYIYILDDGSTTPVTYKTGVYQVQVDSTLNMRSGAGTSNSYVTSVPNNAKLTVTKIQENGGYTWGYTSYNGKNGWVALDYCKYVSALPQNTTTQPTTAKATQPTTKATQPTTVAPTTKATQPTTVAPTTKATQPTTVAPTTKATQPTTVAPTTVKAEPTTAAPETESPTTIPAYDDEAPTTPERVGIGCGDINEDGAITVSDATLVQKYLSDLVVLTANQIKWCDFNFDGKVTIDDVSAMQRYASAKYY